MLDFYEAQNKLFLTQVYEKIQAEEDLSADQVLFEIVQEHFEEGIESLSLDVPLKFPKCVGCKLLCPGFESCKEKEIVWMWKQHKNNKRKKPNSKIFTPYTQRVVEFYINTEVDENLPRLEAFGANSAPLTMRAHYLLKRFSKQLNTNEVYPALSVNRLSQTLKIPQSHFIHYKHLVGGEESRQYILDALLAKDLIFVYQQDYQRLIHNLDTFEAFFSALTGFLKYKGLCEKQPSDVPLKQGWIEFPKTDMAL